MSVIDTGALRIGTRASKLALAQTGLVAGRLADRGGREVTLVEVSTHGDRSSAAIAEMGGTGVFVSALRERLLAGAIDVAVHSYKDLPTAAAEGLVLAAVPPREDPRDALVARDGLTLGGLPPGSRVGTGAPRRSAQLRALGLGLEIVPVRGNVDTRIAKVSAGELDAVVVARAGLARLDRLDAVTEVLDPVQVLPAPAQGALAVECRADDVELRELLALLDDPESRAAVAAERALLAALEAGCTAPVGALAEIVAGDPGNGVGSGIPGLDADEILEVFLRGSVTAVDGSDAVRLSATGQFSRAEEVGRRLAAELIDAGAAQLL